MATVYVALLRAVNVGGTGKLPMSELRKMCESAGFESVRTYIASGNVVFASEAPAAVVKAALESRLAQYAGKPVGVMIRTSKEMAAILEANPFPDAPPNRVVTVFLDDVPPRDALRHAIGVRSEAMRLGKREIYIHYGDAMAGSKLKIPAAANGTARNMNTVAQLAVMSGQ